ncbi:OLC1v1037194C1 [Oldenlandia corymbosa var. corymbosa]|nr:OLC1v1037194C1 [Oldenlandia corymbosa var. corymbosa]
MDRDRGSSREMEYDNGRDRYLDDLRERSREHDQGYDNIRDHDRMRDRFSDRERFHEHDNNLDNGEQERERMRDYNRERVRDTRKDIHRTANHHKASERDEDEKPKFRETSHSNEYGKRARSSESADDDHAEVTKRLEISSHKYEELQKEMAEMEELAEEKKLLVLKLQEKSKKLEESLSAAKRDRSYREMQLTKLTKCYLQVRDCSEQLKRSEQELQSLVSSTMSELEHGALTGARDSILANGTV